MGWRSHEWRLGWSPHGRLARIQLASRPLLPSWTVRTSPTLLRTSPPQVLLRRRTDLRCRIWLRLLALGTDRVEPTPCLGLRGLLLSERARSGRHFATS